jgi:hypothetical protein
MVLPLLLGISLAGRVKAALSLFIRLVTAARNRRLNRRAPVSRLVAAVTAGAEITVGRDEQRERRCRLLLNRRSGSARSLAASSPTAELDENGK